jgi:hypothetical protein
MYFLNSHNRDHKNLYGPDAFYDLDNHGHQAGLATDLLSGDTCAVISYADKNRNVVQISWYKFLKERSAYDEKGMVCRVFDGVLQKTESLLKTDAAKDPKLARFFNIKGHFKQFSVMA